MTIEQFGNIQLIAGVYGRENQLEILMEECAELIQAASKVLRNEYVPENIEHLAEEIADVTIMIEQIKYLYDLNCNVDKQIDAKIQRQMKRIEENDMAKTLKCDRCGTDFNFRPDDEVAVCTLDYDLDCDIYNKASVPFNLCPECMKSFLWWINSVKIEGN